MAKTEETLTFSSREMEVLALAWQCFESEPKIDIKKLAHLAGYTEGSAIVTIGKIKRKLKLHVAGMAEGNAAPAPASKKKPAAKTPKSGKRTKSTALDDESPSKKKKKLGKLKAPSNIYMQQQEEEEFKVKTKEGNGILRGLADYYDDDAGHVGGDGGYGRYDVYDIYQGHGDGTV